jgi:hypothetical protein
MLLVSFLFVPVAYADTAAAPIGNPYIDTLQLWSSIASSIESIAQDAMSTAAQLASTLQHLPTAPARVQAPSVPATSPPQTASLAEAVASFESASDSPATSTEPAPIPTSDQTTNSLNVKSAELSTTQHPSPTTQSAISAPTNVTSEALTAPSDTNFVTEPELAAQLLQLSNSLASKLNSTQFLTVPGWAASQQIGQLNGTTITNANLTASEIPALNYLSLSGGTIAGNLAVTGAFSGGALSLSTASTTNFSNFGTAYFGGTATTTIDSGGNLTVGGSLIANGNVTLGNGTSTTFYATTASSTDLFASVGNLGTLSAGALTLTSSGLGVGIATSQIGTGTGPGGYSGSTFAFNFMNITGDTIAEATSGDPTTSGLQVVDNVGGTGASGNRAAIYAKTRINGTMGNSGFYGGGWFWGDATQNAGGGLGTESGNVYGDNPEATLESAATHYWSLTGEEIDVAAYAGSSVKYKIGLDITTLKTDATQGSTLDAAEVISAATTSPGWNYGLDFSDFNHGGPAFPISSGGTLIYADTSGTVQSLIDLHNVTCSGGNEMELATNFIVDCLGNITGNSIDTSAGYQIGGKLTLYASSTLSNIDLGYLAGAATTTTGTNNIAIGLSSLASVSSGGFNVAVGNSALSKLGNGTANVAVGSNALSNNQGSNNTAVGTYALGNVTTSAGGQNTALGRSAGAAVTLGTNNVFVGAYAASTSASGSNNIALGYDIALPSVNGSNQLDIGNLIFGTNVNGQGNTVSTGSVGVGTTTPSSKLTIWGTDNASSTLAFNVVNSASTTVFSVFDGGNAELSGSLSQSSDQRLKTNIKSLGASSSLSLIDSLNPVTFNWIDPNQTTTLQLGFIAQQVQQIFPNLVSTTSATALTPDGTLSLNYIGLISPIVSAIQALSGEVQSLIAEVQGFAQSFVSNNITASQELCVGSTCVTPAQFQAMVAAASDSQSSAQQNNGGTDNDSSSDSATDTPPQIQINGDNPATVQVGDTYNDLGATITDPQADLNLGITTYLNGIETSPVEIDTSAAATDTIDYAVTDQNGLTSTSTRTVIIEGSPSIVPTDDASTTADDGEGDVGSADNSASSTNATTTSQ